MSDEQLLQKNQSGLSNRSDSLISRGLLSLERITWTSRNLFEFEEEEFEDGNPTFRISPDGQFFHSYICDGPSGDTGRCYVRVLKFNKDQSDVSHYLTRDDFVDGRQYLERDYFGNDSFGDDGAVLNPVAWSACGRYLIAGSLFCSDTFIFHLVPDLSNSLWFPDSQYDIADWSPYGNFIIESAWNGINIVKAVWSDDSQDRQLLGIEPYKQIKFRKLAEPEVIFDSRKQKELEALLSNLIEQIVPGPRAVGQFVRLLSLHFSEDQMNDIGPYMTTFLHRHFYEYPDSNGVLGVSLEHQLAGERRLCQDRVLSAKTIAQIKTSLTNRKTTTPSRDENRIQPSEEIVRRNVEIEAMSETEILSELQEATIELKKLDHIISKYKEQWESENVICRECSFSPDGQLVYSMLERNAGYRHRDTIILLINEFPSFNELLSVRLNAPKNFELLNSEPTYSRSWFADQRSLLISIDGTLKEIRFDSVHGQFEFIDHDAFGHIVACNPKFRLVAVTNDHGPDDNYLNVAIKRHSDFSTVGEYELPSRATSLQWNRDGSKLWIATRDGVAIQAEIPARLLQQFA